MVFLTAQQCHRTATMSTEAAARGSFFLYEHRVASDAAARGVMNATRGR
jgi:hypothetical protein